MIDPLKRWTNMAGLIMVSMVTWHTFHTCFIERILEIKVRMYLLRKTAKIENNDVDTTKKYVSSQMRINF